MNTEKLHYLAYKKMCADRGFSLQWDMSTYIRHAMYSADGLKEGLYQELPDLYRYEPCWDILYQEKKRAYSGLLLSRGTELMPGVEDLLKGLDQAHIKRCVVTHSAAEQIEVIRSQHAILNTIPVWITREDYQQPKPASECYEKAIAQLGEKGDRIMGFEDSPRGLQALLGTEAEAVLVTEMFTSHEIETLSRKMERPFRHVSDFLNLAESGRIRQ
ncbi:MAG: hypothetical protein S4CHLAM2_09630 [Chlamydiales bacterium]|nr:hypothetical protein [Chlamydiales bacterium]